MSALVTREVDALRHDISAVMEASTAEITRLRRMITVLEGLLIANTGEDIGWIRRAVADAMKG